MRSLLIVFGCTMGLCLLLSMKMKKKQTQKQKIKEKEFKDDEDRVNSEGWSRKYLIQLLEIIVRLNDSNQKQGVSRENLSEKVEKTGYCWAEQVIDKMLKHLTKIDKIFMTEWKHIYVI